MIIPDTSVWIEFFKAHDPWFPRLRMLLERQEVLALSVIFGELLQGARSKREKSVLLQYWQSLPKIDETGLMIKAGIYSQEHKLVSAGVGLIDACLIAAAIETSSAIWTLDEKLNRVLNKDLIYRPDE
jgi:predicted nucleic acid-binding protein